MKKSILFLSLFFTLLIVQAQNQISELQRGLIFHWAGSEWFPTQDLVSGTVGTATATYNVLDRQGSGRRSLSFNGTSDLVTLPSIPAFGAGDFTVVMKVNIKSLGNTEAIMCGLGNTSFYLQLSNSGTIGVVSYGTGSNYSTQQVIVGDNVIVYKKTNSQGVITVNGIAKTVTDNFNYSAEHKYFGIDPYVGSYFSGSISMCRIFNNSTVDIAYYSKPENPIKVADLSACKLNLNAEGINRQNISTVSAGYWWDATNNITATVSGATVVIPPASNLGATWFNGTTSKIQYTNILDNYSYFSLSFWCCPSYITTTYEPIYSEGWNANSGVYIGFYNYRMDVRLANSGYEVLSINSMISENIWSHFVVTYNGKVANVYKNGINVGSMAFTKTTSGGDPAIIGSSTTAGGSYGNFYFSGVISDIPIWSRVLDTDQIKLLYESGH